MVCSLYGQFEGHFTVAISDMVDSILGQLEGHFTVAISDHVGYALS